MKACPLLALAAGVWPLLGAQATAQTVGLQIDEPFPVLGGTVTFTLTGPAGAPFEIRASNEPAEIQLAFGTLFLDPAGMVPLLSGAIPGGGTFVQTVFVPGTPGLDGQQFYIQGGVQVGPQIELSNAVTVRFGSAPASGARQPEALAITPDGSKLYVAHHEDGSVSIVDTATDTLVRDMPVGPVPAGHGLPIAVAVDPEGRHAFVVNPWTRHMAVIHVATDSIAAQVPVPPGSRGIAFDFAGPTKTVYLTNELANTVLVLVESPPGTFTQTGSIPLEGRGPGPIVPIPGGSGGRLLVGHRTSHDLEVIDPALAPGSQTVARIAIDRLPYDIEVVGDTAFVPTFDTFAPGDGRNELLEVDLTTLQAVGNHLFDHGTDYLDCEVAGSRLALVGGGSGSVVLADAATFAFQEIVDLAPFQVLTTPQAAEFLVDGGGVPQKLYVVNYFRETVAVIDLTGSPPFAVNREIALSHAGVPLLALVDLTQEDDGDWFFRSVQLFNGTPQNPNRVTCATCHPFGASSDGFTHPFKQAMPLFDAGATGPWGSTGSSGSLGGLITGAVFAHSTLGLGVFPGGDQDVLAFLASGNPPPASPFLEDDGSLSTSAQVGQVVFEGSGNCSSCHTAPLFIPIDPDPKTIPGGVGTGLVPANVPSLRGVWMTAPYLHDHAAPTLMDVLTNNPGDLHGTTSTLTPQEIEDLVAYLKSL
ncbi:MAG: c-type cytochrome [Planctomycetota bacterium]|nr:c-type cytochrome [Planctomycetota bacterium]